MGFPAAQGSSSSNQTASQDFAVLLGIEGALCRFDNGLSIMDRMSSIRPCNGEVCCDVQIQVGVLALDSGVARGWCGGNCLAGRTMAARAQLGKRYTATALLQIAPCRPHVLSQAAEKYDPAEFAIFRETQKGLMTSRFVIVAALRDPRLKDRACTAREDIRHNAIAWLTGEIHVDFPDKIPVS